MTVLNIQTLKVTVGNRELLDLQNLQVQAKDRIGLIGKNGSGKSTLFKVLTGEIEADNAQFSAQGTVAMLPQLKKSKTSKSGGEVSQDAIIRLFRKSPQILLADEPTTNLDTSHVEWVEKKLLEFQGTLLLVSHDRTLLDHVCNKIWALENGKITEYSGNYSDYVAQKEIEEKHQQKEYQKFKEKEQQLKQAIVQKEQQAAQATKKPKHVSRSEARQLGAQDYYAGKQQTLHRNTKSLQTRLEKLEVVEKPKDEPSIQMDLPNTRAFENKTILRAEKFTGQVKGKKLWGPATFFLKGGDKVGIIGPNGSGKTTLIKKILKASADGLYVSPTVKIGYFAQDLDILNLETSILENVQENSKQKESLIRTVLARLGFVKEDVYKKIKVLSGGERVKVSLAKIFVSDSNTLILDEPTNFLDIYALEALEDLLKQYKGTLLVVSHDRQFISAISSKILAFNQQKLQLFEGSYQEYLNYSPTEKRDIQKESLMKIELEITSVLSQLGDPLLPKDEKETLDARFQLLLQKKRELE